MVIESPSRGRDSSGEHARSDRGQLVLIAAISIAFILLGVVVVFNGVLYTQTVSSSAAEQSLSEPSVIELEVEDAVCALADEEDGIDDSEGGDADQFEELYSKTSSSSGSSIINVDLEQSGDTVQVDITYTKSDLEFENTTTVNTDECPSEDE